MKAAEEPRFNLVTEPWIPVRRGAVTELLSLASAFERAREVDALACELPVMDMSVMRILIAITIRATSCVYDDDEVTSYEAWRALWERQGQLSEIAGGYLANHYDEFYLLHPTHPFMQVPSMESMNGSYKNVRSIILDFPDSNRGSQFFQRMAQSAESLSYAEAARWLLTCHAYDVAGIKTGMVGDPRAKGGKVSSSNTGWAGAIGGILIEGSNLHETILLNAPLWESPTLPDELPNPDDLPAWERGVSEICLSERVPTGPVDILTWQSRRIRLIPDEDEDRIVATLVTHGDRIGFANKQDIEPMSAWRRNMAMEKREKSAVQIYTPIGHMPSRSFWRGLNALLPQIKSEDDAPDFRSPMTLRWIGTLMGPNGRGALPKDYRIRLHAIGVSYGTQNAVISEMIDDSVTLSPSLMGEDGVQANLVIRECIDLTEQGVSALAYLGQSLMATINGKTDDSTSKGRGDIARQQAYLMLDSKFASWVSTVTPESDLIALRTQWLQTAKRDIIRIGRQMTASMPPASYVGKECSIGRNKGYANAGSVESTFLWRVGEIFGRDTPTHHE